MQRILHELYYGRIYPSERGVPKNSEYRKLHDKISDEIDCFNSILNEEQRNRLEQLEDIFANASDMEIVDAFSYGFKLATLIMIDVFNGADDSVLSK